MMKNFITVSCTMALILSFSSVPAFASLTGSTLTHINTYKPGATNTLVYRCDNASVDEEWLFTVSIQYISNMFVTAGLPAAGDKDTMSYSNALGEAILARWDSDDTGGKGYGAIGDGSSAFFTNEVAVGSSVTGDVVLTYYLFGDGYASDPHGLTNTLALQRWSPGVYFTPASYRSRKINTSVTLLNDTGAAGDFNLSYIKGVSNGWQVSGPASVTGVANGDTRTFNVEVLITNSYLGETQTSTVVAVSATYPLVIATATVVSVSADNVVELPLNTVTGRPANLGVEYDGTFFWVTSRGETTNNNLLSKLDANGNLVTQYIQSAHGEWGWHDLAWDGTYLYASDSSNVDIINPETGLTNGSFTGPENPNRALAYDPASNHFWTANFRSDIYEFDRSGTVITQFPNAFAIYGMAWDDITPGGPFLWVWFTEATGPPSIFDSASAWQFDPVSGVYTGVSFVRVDPPGGIAGGACFANFNGKDTFFGLHQAMPDDVIVGYVPTVIPEAGFIMIVAGIALAYFKHR